VKTYTLSHFLLSFRSEVLTEVEVIRYCRVVQDYVGDNTEAMEDPKQPGPLVLII
jgi:hypothetical protein